MKKLTKSNRRTIRRFCKNRASARFIEGVLRDAFRGETPPIDTVYAGGTAVCPQAQDVGISFKGMPDQELGVEFPHPEAPFSTPSEGWSLDPEYRGQGGWGWGTYS